MWWVAGGWALDLFLGDIVRAHGDLDIGIFRDDAAAVTACLPDWDVFEAKNGLLKRLDLGAAPRADVNSLWCRPVDSHEWALELLLDDRTEQNWVFRRRPEIVRPLVSMHGRSSDGLPYLVPEIQLLYKAKAPRPRDEDDFERVLPYLEPNAAAWLKQALEVAHPEHPWIERLEPR
jgi:aminoglycoside-2''-adenylyltransferase